MVSEVNATRFRRWQSKPKCCAETHTRGRLNAYLDPDGRRDLRERRSAQRLPHSADKDEAGGTSPPRPAAGPEQRKRWLDTGEGSSWCASRAACARNSGCEVLAHGPLSREWPPRLRAPPALLGGSRASLPRHAGYSWLGMRLRPGWSRTQAHMSRLEAGHAVHAEQLQRADDLAGEDVDRPLDSAFPAGHQPIEVGPADQAGPGAQGDRGDDIGAASHAAVDQHLGT